MRWSKQLIPTLKEVPQEAEIPSHRLMLRAGCIRKLSSGLYTFLPLGVRSLQKVERIVREEMDRAGALEVLMPALQPRDIWERSGRLEVMRDVMFSMEDRQQRALVLGPTHEEVITGLVAHEIKSYRQLPKLFYQIQIKFRDEIRPRFGLMRAKEFIMKDAYSFDRDREDAEASYQAIYAAYIRIFKRCGLRVKVVEADSGVIGGSSSHEFMVLADAGEDGLVECDQCAYAANLEQAEGLRRDTPEFEAEPLPLEEVETLDKKSVADVADFLGVPEAQLVKTLIYTVGDKPVAVLIPGDCEVNEIKLCRAFQVPGVVLAADPVVGEVTGAPVGFAGPVRLSIPIYADRRLQGCTGGVVGANKKDYHLRHAALGRDVDVTAYVDITHAKAGDRCPRCDGALTEKRGIEVGHVFKLGTNYSEKLGALYLDENGRRQPAVMGCYGIGVSRTLQAVIEQDHDEQGIRWPISVAPYSVELLVINVSDTRSVRVAEELMAYLEEQGVDVLCDDRDERPGIKFKDADLIGLPVRISVGERSLAQECIEVKMRDEKEAGLVPLAEARAVIMKKIQDLKSCLNE